MCLDLIWIKLFSAFHVCCQKVRNPLRLSTQNKPKFWCVLTYSNHFAPKLKSNLLHAFPHPHKAFYIFILFYLFASLWISVFADTQSRNTSFSLVTEGCQGSLTELCPCKRQAFIIDYTESQQPLAKRSKNTHCSLTCLLPDLCDWGLSHKGQRVQGKTFVCWLFYVNSASNMRPICNRLKYTCKDQKCGHENMQTTRSTSIV